MTRFFTYQDTKCINLLSKALRLNSEYLPTLILLAELIRATGDTHKAATYFEHALSLDLKQSHALKRLAQIHLHHDNAHVAYFYYEQVLTLHREINTAEDDLIVIDEDWKLKLGVAMAALGDRQKAYVMFYDALSGNGDFGGARKEMGKLTLSKRIKQARETQQYFSEGTILQWLLEISEEIHRLHQCNIVHEYVIPCNFIVLDDDKIVMLGGCKSFQFEEGEKAKCFTDNIHSFGLIILELCTLSAPDPGLEENMPDISIMYSRKLSELLNLMLSEERPNAETLFNKLCKWVLLGRSFVNKFGQRVKEEVIGKPLHKY